ncbi:MAG: DNA-processing protein DprA [Gemmatimonadales bacterium]
MTDIHYVTLALVPGIGRALVDLMLSRFGSAEAALAATEKELAEVPGMGRRTATAVRRASLEEGRTAVERTRELGGVVLVPHDPRFPAALAVIPDAPLILFAAGRLEILNREAIAVVGSRMHTRYGTEACRFLAGGAARAGLVVVSGMARGLDAVAHQAALDQGGDTVGVLGNGLGVVYPSANRRLYERVQAGGCLITESPPGSRPHAGSFPKRNRLISGLAKATLVVEARQRSGALITVDCALQQGKEVLVVPGQITSPLSLGCNRLIQAGAKAALGLRDILEEYGIAAHVPAVSLPSDLSQDERRVLDALSLGVEHVDDVADHIKRPAAEALALLTNLEIRGLVMQEQGKVFKRLALTS